MLSPSVVRHTAPGGALIVEPRFTPEVWERGRLTADLGAQPAREIARLLVRGRVEGVSTCVG
jgi:hypothetical protein